MPKILSIIFVLFLVLTGITAYLISNKSISVPQVNSVFAPLPSPTPMPFAEMTIPYLRNRNYESSLGNLEKYQENADFTFYLTSFDSDGLKINGLLTIPKGEPPTEGYPAIVFVHGYIAPTIYETTTRYTDYVNALARSGFVVFKIDLRGHGDSEGEAGGAYYSSDYVVDTLNAYKALQNADFVDAGAIGLWGHSMAGNVISRSLAVKPDIPALVVWAGAGYTYSDLQEFMINDQSYRPPTQSTQRARRRQLLRDTYGEFDANHPFWRQVAITNYLKDLKGAISIHHPVDDNVVSVEYTRNLKKLLDENNVSNEVYEYQTGGHNLTGSTFTTAMSRTVDFFHKYLK